MDFGLFAEQTRRGASQDDAFQEMFALVDASEAWGLDVFWLAEMLVNPARSVLSAPLLVASWIASRTKRLRVGTAVQLLPLNHPLRRFRHRPQRLPARLRRTRRSLWREPGAVLRGARDHARGLEGRALHL